VVIDGHRQKLDVVDPTGKGFDRERALFEVPDMPKYRARNPQTGEEMTSDDGQNWKPAR
jgi:hypothetical protein